MCVCVCVCVVCVCVYSNIGTADTVMNKLDKTFQYINKSIYFMYNTPPFPLPPPSLSPLIKTAERPSLSPLIKTAERL